MATVNMLEAKTNLSRLVESVESGSEAEIIIARNGKPAARLVPVIAKPDVSKRLGLLEGPISQLLAGGIQCDRRSGSGTLLRQKRRQTLPRK